MDLVIDHSVQVDVARSENAVQANMELEFERNKERFGFLKWGSKAFKNMLVVPPGSGIVHQVSYNLALPCCISLIIFSFLPFQKSIFVDRRLCAFYFSQVFDMILKCF